MAGVQIHHGPPLGRGEAFASHRPSFCWNRQILFIVHRVFVVHCPALSSLIKIHKSNCLYVMRAHEVNKKQVKAGAPTGIAAANVEIDGTDVCAQTIHSLFDLDNEYKSPPHASIILTHRWVCRKSLARFEANWISQRETCKKSPN